MIWLRIIFRCPVKGCPYRFAKIDLLKRHETCHINGTRSPFCCPECKEQFSSWRMCSIHLWKCHKVDIDFYTCPLCDYKGSTYGKNKKLTSFVSFGMRTCDWLIHQGHICHFDVSHSIVKQMMFSIIKHVQIDFLLQIN